MDDDAAELSRLRRRAYAPDGDIHADPTALARLGELEERVRLAAGLRRVDRDAAAPGERDARDAVDPGAAGPVTADPGAADPGAVGSGAARARRPRRHTAAIAAVGVAAVLLAGAAWQSSTAPPAAAPSPEVTAERFGEASPFSGDPTARVIQEIPVDGSFGDGGGQGASRAAPPFPVPDALRWSAPLGDYYGWDLWLARSAGGLPCLAVVAGDEVRADCRPLADFDLGALVVAVPYAAIPAEERPAGMTSTQSLGYQWLGDQSVTIVLGRTGGLWRE